MDASFLVYERKVPASARTGIIWFQSATAVEQANNVASTCQQPGGCSFGEYNWLAGTVVYSKFGEDVWTSSFHSYKQVYQMSLFV